MVGVEKHCLAQGFSVTLAAEDTNADQNNSKKGSLITAKTAWSRQRPRFSGSLKSEKHLNITETVFLTFS